MLRRQDDMKTNRKMATENQSKMPGVPVVRAVGRAIALLKAFSAANPRQTLSQLSSKAELDKGTTRRLLNTLVLNGLVAQDDRTGSYSLTFAVLELASAVEIGRDFGEAAAPYLAEIAEMAQATAYLWVYHEGTALCVGRVRVPTPGTEVTWATIGTRLPLNCGAGPRVLLSFICSDQRDHVLSGPIATRTPYSETDVGKLQSGVERILRQGWEFAVDDFVVGLSALGVPVFDRQNEFVGSISVTTLTTHMNAKSTKKLIPILQDAARKIGAELI